MPAAPGEEGGCSYTPAYTLMSAGRHEEGRGSLKALKAAVCGHLSCPTIPGAGGDACFWERFSETSYALRITPVWWERRAGGESIRLISLQGGQAGVQVLPLCKAELPLFPAVAPATWPEGLPPAATTLQRQGKAGE